MLEVAAVPRVNLRHVNAPVGLLFTQALEDVLARCAVREELQEGNNTINNEPNDKLESPGKYSCYVGQAKVRRKFLTAEVK